MASMFYAFAAGRGRIINILFSVYMAKLLVLEAPFLSSAITNNLPDSFVGFQQLAAFLVLFFILFILLGRFVFRTSADGRGLGSMLFGLLFAFFQLGLLINIIVGYLPESLTNSFGPLVRLLFMGENISFVWLVLPVVYLVLLGKFVGDHSEI